MHKPLPLDAIAAAVAQGQSVLLCGTLSAVGLDGIAAALTGCGSRVVRIMADAPVSLPGLLARMLGRAEGSPLSASELEQGFALLTEPGAGFTRVVLLVDRGDALDAAALRYIQFASRDAPLCLVCAGGEPLEALLRRDEFGVLRRLVVRPESPEPVGRDVAGPVLDRSPIPSGALRPSKDGGGRRWARLCVAACVGLMLWLKPLPELAAALTGLPGAIREVAAR